MSATAYAVSFANHLVQLYVAATLSGLASGGMEAGVNVWLLEIWSDKSCPWMQVIVA